MGKVQMHVPRKGTGKICVRNGESLQLMHVPEDYIKAPSVDRSVGNCEEKEVKERERSEGKRIGEARQSVKEREWREERDLRAVEERERSEEQLERWRETRRRKGLEVSQMVAL
ncbi:hypothetical protein V6N13_092848 [Hibiscus sabdariffa]|uniref:Uncharacterized protein n=1 Tax=Hibiscus sabdariffa TaxID=183260 RepID=A0ABR2P823_9ROSI